MLKNKALSMCLLFVITFCLAGCEIEIGTGRQSTPSPTGAGKQDANAVTTPGITLEEAQKKPGIYMKDGDKFVFLETQWEYIDRGGYMNTQSLRSDSISTVFHAGSGSASSRMPILFDADHRFPQIRNDTQFVIIGITNIAIYEILHEGWTIPVGLSLGTPGGPNPGGWIQTYTDSKIISYSGDRDQAFEEINGRPPTDFVDRMLYTGFYFALCSYHGIFTGMRGEEFTFSWMQGTDWIEKTYTADKRFYTLPTSETHNAPSADYEIVETRNGYFEVNFLTPPMGYYAVGNRIGIFDRIVEFVSP